MKITTGTIIGAVSAFVWSLFMGVTVGSIGIGAVLPQVNLIAQPFVCPNGQMTLTEYTTQPLPTTTYTMLNWYCVDKLTGAKTELDIFPMSLYAGLFYGFLFFLVIALIWSVYQLRHPASARAAQGVQDPELAELQSLERAGHAWNPAPQLAQLGHLDRASRPANKDTEMAELENLERSGRAASNAGRSGAQARMDELKGLRDSNSITEAEYQKKRSEILRDI